jgi:hypothetical protein
MIKLSASVSKKVPVPDVEFSSDSYSAGLDVEMSSDASTEDRSSESLAVRVTPPVTEQVQTPVEKRGEGRAKNVAPGALYPVA